MARITRKRSDREQWVVDRPQRCRDLLRVAESHYPWGLLFFLLVATAGCSDGDVESTDLELEAGLRLEMVAKEPLVIDPVAFAYDEQGYLYVVEDRGYPDPMEEDESPAKEGRIARLEDTDGDDRYDRRTEFATGLTYPNGIMPWRGGVFVTVAPDILYLKDTDGDGVADEEQVVLTGFKDTKTSQLRMSHPTLGFDGWVYLTSGLNGGEVYSPLYPERPPVTFTSSDVRFHPDTYEIEMIGGKSQFGMTFDRYGRRFGCSNRHPVQHIVFHPSDLNRNPYLSFNETVHNVSKVEAEAMVFPISDATTSADFIPDLMGQPHSGTFTAASGVFIYHGSGLTPDHRGDVFIAESAQNLVQRQKMSPDGVSFSSELVYEGKEFLASEDEWFRPVFHGIGPADGLHVVDMHRKVIDHPSYVPERVREKLDFQAGNEKGRIYKILAEGQSSSLTDKQWVNDSMPVSQIVAWLTSDKQWDRETAHRLLLQRNDPSILPQLRTTVKESPQPESRVRALWLLHSLGGLDPETLQQAMADEKAGVRENAVLLSKGKMIKSEALKKAVIGACKDSNIRVRFNCALTLGDVKGPEITEALASLAVSDGDNRWMRAAVLSGIGGRMGAFLQYLQARQPANADTYAFVMEDLARVLGNGGAKQELRRLVETTLHADEKSGWRFGTMLGLMEGLVSRRNFEQSPNEFLEYVYGANVPGSVRTSWERFVDEVTSAAETTEENRADRVAAIELMGFITGTESLPVFKKALQPENPRAIQLAVVRAIGRQNTREGAQLLMDEEQWAGYTPNVRSAVLAEMLSTPVFAKALLDAIEGEVVAPSEISSVDRQRLMTHQDEAIRQRAESLFAELEGGARKEVYEEYLSILNEEKGDPKVGADVFERVCSVCHTYAGQGGEVGPDLTGIKNQPKDAILLHTIMPNYEVYPSYQTVVIETNEGRSLSGWIVTETDNGVTIRTASGADETVMRDNIASLSNTGQSLMPYGLEKTMTKEEMAGLIRYLKSGSEF